MAIFQMGEVVVTLGGLLTACRWQPSEGDLLHRAGRVHQ